MQCKSQPLCGNSIWSSPWNEACGQVCGILHVMSARFAILVPQYRPFSSTIEGGSQRYLRRSQTSRYVTNDVSSDQKYSIWAHKRVRKMYVQSVRVMSTSFSCSVILKKEMKYLEFLRLQVFTQATEQRTKDFSVRYSHRHCIKHFMTFMFTVRTICSVHLWRSLLLNLKHIFFHLLGSDPIMHRPFKLTVLQPTNSPYRDSMINLVLYSLTEFQIISYHKFLNISICP